MHTLWRKHTLFLSYDSIFNKPIIILSFNFTRKEYMLILRLKYIEENFPGLYDFLFKMIFFVPFPLDFQVSIILEGLLFILTFCVQNEMKRETFVSIKIAETGNERQIM